ncbi:unnamed protein product [Lampetra planeri]
MEGAGEVAASDTTGVQDVIAAAGPSASTGTEDSWRHVADQLDSLRAVLLDLVTLVAPAMMLGQPRVGPSSGEPSGGAEPSAIGASARLPTLPDTWQDAAILGVVAAERREAAILSPPRGTPASEDSSSGTRSHRLMMIKEFTVGGDWCTFAWRFESAVRSAKWMDAEALEVLPTLLDDKSLKFFRSIAAAKKATLKGAFDEMAEAYEPPDDAHRRFVQRQRAPEESLVAFQGAVVELAMAAYPETVPDLLEPLILGKMLELSKDLGIPLPMTAWMGSPTVEGDAVFMLDERGPGDLTAAAT